MISTVALPTNGRDDIVERWPVLKKKYEKYRVFAHAGMDSILPKEKKHGYIRLKANMQQSCYLRNEGGGKFTMIPLPLEAQVSMINGMVADDFDGDGNVDVLINGNDFGTDISIGRYDGMNGLLLKGDGAGGFSPLTIQQSGIYIPGNGKALIKLAGSNNNYLIAASQNRDNVKVFGLRKNVQIVRINPDDKSSIIHLKNGKHRKEEFYFGTSFLSQSSRFIPVTPQISSIEITNNKGEVRKSGFE